MMKKWLKDKTRLLFAGLFVFGGLLVGVLVASLVLPTKTPHELLGLGAVTLFFLLVFVAREIFDPDNALTYEQRLEAAEQKHEAYIQELEQQGLLESTEYRAKRAFQVEEFEDEGSHYYIELENGSVLFLSGQYLFDYEPIDDDPEYNQQRLFPCTEFTVRMHTGEWYVVDLICRGEVFEPELLAPPFDFKKDSFPMDGKVITNQTYNEIKQERMNRR